MDFIKLYTPKALIKKLFLLDILSFFDIICTLILIEAGSFFEIDTIVKDISSKPWISFIIKIILIIVLMLNLYRGINYIRYSLKYLNYFICFSILLYILVNILNLILIFK